MSVIPIRFCRSCGRANVDPRPWDQREPLCPDCADASRTPDPKCLSASEADDALEGWVAVVRFPDQSPSFAHGFEAGEVWRTLKDDPGYHECTTMTENRELYKDIAAHLRYTCEIEPSEVEGWDYIKFIPVAPLHLRIVQ